MNPAAIDNQRLVDEMQNRGRAPCGMPELAEHDEAEAVEPKVAGGRGGVFVAWR